MTRAGFWRGCLRAWRSPNAFELLCFGGVACALLLLSLFDLPTILAEPDWPKILTRQIIEPVSPVLIAMLLWLPAERLTPNGPMRRWAMLGVVLMTALLSMSLVFTLISQLQWRGLGDVYRMKRGLTPDYEFGWRAFLGASALVCLLAGLGVALLSSRARLQREARHLERLIQQRQALQHQTTLAQLSALQARLEPRFLFDSLVRIAAHYETEPGQAGSQLDRLIQHLRLTLPSLRQGAPLPLLSQEIALLRSYLAVRSDQQSLSLDLHVELDSALLSRRLAPMLLLPCAQLLLDAEPRAAGHLTLRGSLSGEGRLTLRLSRQPGGPIPAQDRLQELNERLWQLGAPTAGLQALRETTHTWIQFEVP